ncbi:hypothetical protein A2886_02355 [candidate division WWE3 bacterium RIFCSPHIGHO2_01_FULL_42_13]|uniref:Uncharacterized protein n=1 Tax=candidate division WWE3 bacterium RIFCSPHIGHO2_01_FULL_42_13 TaxID=1802617 RepID=A0A1F4URR7_UNCKA|nr:MAG: hypothetical protein A2886_02355 [candidate division WWE3 bacterium RIFCSPHIGHO2_01_FULL_42_13]
MGRTTICESRLLYASSIFIALCLQNLYDYCVSRLSLPKITPLILCLAFILIVGFGAFYFIPGFREKFMQSDNNGASPFGEDSLVDNVPYEPELNEAAKAFYNFLNVSKEPSYWENWDYKTSFFQGDVLSVDSEARTATINVDRPTGLGQLTNVPILCEIENTAIFYDVNMVFQDSNIDIFNELEIGEILYANCLDANCTSVGGYCTLVERDIYDDE